MGEPDAFAKTLERREDGSHMKSRHLIDPELVQALDSFPRIDFDAEHLDEARRFTDSFLLEPDPSVFPDVAMSEHLIPGPPGAPDLRGLLYRPIAAGVPGPLPALLHLHGGAYVLGKPEASDASNRARVERLQCAVFSVDYRVAPQTPHPGAVQDAHAALIWLHENAAALGVDADRIAVIGESAGGGLAAALALYARDHGGPALRLQVLLYPMLDDRVGSTDEPHPYAGEFVFRRDDCAKSWAHYLGRAPGLPGTDPHASPARASDLSGLPAVCISVGALDLFVEENIEYARRLIRAGVPTELHVHPGGPHGAETIVPNSKFARRFNAEYLDAIKRGLGID